jgi:hypothetical protein
VRLLLPLLLLDVALASAGDERPKPAPDTHRNEEQTYLTLPEWYIVYSSDEYARFITSRPPSDFPYFLSVARFWEYYASVYEATLRYPFNGGYHLMNAVIGVSYSAELLLKGVYENTVGRFAAFFASYETTEEDRFAAGIASDYVAFIDTHPWYDYPFGKALLDLWKNTPPAGPHMLRKWERRGILSFEYAFKAGYGWLMRQGTEATYDPESEETAARVRGLPGDLAALDPRIRLLKKEGDGSSLVALPRYQPFTAGALLLARRGVQFEDILGNSRILVTALLPRGASSPGGEVLFASVLPIEPDRERLALTVTVHDLRDTLLGLEARGAVIEHVYDY